MTRLEYSRLRLPVFLAKGFSRAAAEYFVDLERADRDALVRNLAELSRTPAWPGRRVLLASGRILEYHHGRWNLIV